MGHVLIRHAERAGRPAISACVALVALAGCAQQATTPDGLADRVTRAVYANDVATATADFDHAMRRSVTRENLGDLSDRMHALGALQSVAPKAADPDAGRYEYDARFAGGIALVELRMDPDGKIGAYRFVPGGRAAR